MKFTRTEIPEVVLIEPDCYEDERGFFSEKYNRELYAKNGITAEFVQENHSGSKRGVLRGLHYQLPPKTQAKLVQVIAGEAFDVVVDIRKGSKTFGRHVTTVLSGENKRLVFVPEGFAHGFCALSDNTHLVYKVSSGYSKAQERGILWNDGTLAIAWPKIAGGYLLSDRDKNHPPLKEAQIF